MMKRGVTGNGAFLMDEMECYTYVANDIRTNQTITE